MPFSIAKLILLTSIVVVTFQLTWDLDILDKIFETIEVLWTLLYYELRFWFVVVFLYFYCLWRDLISRLKLYQLLLFIRSYWWTGRFIPLLVIWFPLLEDRCGYFLYYRTLWYRDNFTFVLFLTFLLYFLLAWTLQYYNLRFLGCLCVRISLCCFIFCLWLFLWLNLK